MTIRLPMPHERSKKRRFLRVFEEALPHLARGELVYVHLEKPSLSEWDTIRVYWYQWKRLNAQLSQEGAWLQQVQASFVVHDGTMMMLLDPRKAGDATLTAGNPTGRIEPTVRLAPDEAGGVRHGLQETPEEALAANQALLHVAANSQWSREQGRDPTLWPDNMFYEYAPDSPQQAAFRAQPGVQYYRTPQYLDFQMDALLKDHPWRQETERREAGYNEGKWKDYAAEAEQGGGHE